jgi:hypothetical protein
MKIMKFTLVLFAALLLSAARPAHADPLTHSGLDAGYYDMYNLDFPAAHVVFNQWIHEHPQDPLGPASDAAAFLFGEFDRLGVYDVELFASDNQFVDRSKLVANPQVRADFEARSKQAEALAAQALQQNPRDARALYVRTMLAGMHADFAAMIDKKDYAALKFTEQGSKLAQQTLAVDPNLYDAHIAVGVENYMLALKPAIMRVFFFLRGDSMDKEEGVKQLRICAEKGHFLAPFARLMLAVCDLRDNNKAGARQILAALAQEFPRNTLYERQLQQIH